MSTGSDSRAVFPSRIRDPFAPEPWAARARYIAPDMKHDPAQLASFAVAHMEGDTLGDALAAWLSDPVNDGGRAQFERALAEGIGSVMAPARPLAEFFADVERVPAWLDRSQIARAAGLYHRTYPAAERVLFSASLLAGYVSAGIAKTLVGTGALERMAARRLVETQKFVTDLYGPGELARGSAGYQTTVRVRLMHALVRRQLLARGFATERWGVPINQADMAATALQFSITYVLGLRAVGCHVSAREADAVLHTWRYASKLMGVRDEFVPRSEDEARQQLRMSVASQAGPDADSRALAAALLAVPEQLVIGARAKRLAHLDMVVRAGLARLLLGGVAADGLGLPRGPGTLAPIALFPLVAAAEGVRRAMPFGTRLAVQLGRRMADATSRRRLAGSTPSYLPHTVAAAQPA